MKIGIIGDLILSDKLEIDEKIRDLLQSNDINIANLEAPYIRKGFQPEHRFGLHQLVEDCRILHDLNIAVVSLANNHIGDFGSEGIAFTKQILKDNNISSFGAGMDLDDAITPAELVVNNTKIAFWGFMMRFYSKRYYATMTHHGVPQLNKEIILEALSRSDADIKVLYNHWNQEFEFYPEPICKAMAEDISPYCDLIIGSHSHCLQGIQTYNNCLILYSMGNFSMPAEKFHGVTLMKYPDLSLDSMLVVASINPSDIQYAIHQTVLNPEGNNILLADEVGKNRIEDHLSMISWPLNMKNPEYTAFYNKHKKRKIIFTLRKNERINDVLILISKILYSTLKFSEISLAYMLEKLGLLKIVKTRMSKFISYFQSLR